MWNAQFLQHLQAVAELIRNSFRERQPNWSQNQSNNCKQHWTNNNTEQNYSILDHVVRSFKCLPIDDFIIRNFKCTPTEPDRSFGVIVGVINFKVESPLWFSQVHIEITIRVSIWVKHTCILSQLFKLRATPASTLPTCENEKMTWLLLIYLLWLNQVEDFRWSGINK